VRAGPSPRLPRARGRAPNLAPSNARPGGGHGYEPVVEVAEVLAVGHVLERARRHGVRPHVDARALLAGEREAPPDAPHAALGVDADRAEARAARIVAQEQRPRVAAL